MGGIHLTDSVLLWTSPEVGMEPGLLPACTSSIDRWLAGGHRHSDHHRLWNLDRIIQHLIHYNYPTTIMNTACVTVGLMS